MKDRQEDRLGMYFTVLATCERHADAWENVPAFAEAHAEFAGHVTAIRDQADAQSTGVRGSSRAKADAREALAATAYPIATAIQAWAAVAGEARVAERVRFTRSHFIHSRDTDAEIRARTVLAEATARDADLADYGVDPELIGHLAVAIDTYHDLIIAPRQAIVARSAATAALKKHFAAAHRVLKTRMDNLVPVIGVQNPDFARDYENARVIVDSGE